MKKLTVSLIAVSIILSLCACGAEPASRVMPENAAPAAPADTAEPQTPAPTAAPTPDKAPAAPAEETGAAEDVPAEEPPAVPAAEPPAAAPAPASESAPQLRPAEPVAAEPVTAEAPTAEPPAEEPPAADLKAAAAACIGKSVSALYAAVGMPNWSDYAPSCLSEGGEDGNLYYDGFTVYTFRENGAEEVTYVE